MPSLCNVEDFLLRNGKSNYFMEGFYKVVFSLSTEYTVLVLNKRKRDLAIELNEDAWIKFSSNTDFS